MAYSSHTEFSIIKKRKLDQQCVRGVSDQPTTAFNASTSDIFKGFVVFFDGYTGSTGMDRLQLKECFLVNGGVVKDKLEPAVTHIVADHIIASKLSKIKKDRLVVKPLWITDSVRDKCCKPLRPYLVSQTSDKRLFSYSNNKATHTSSKSSLQQTADNTLQHTALSEDNISHTEITTDNTVQQIEANPNSDKYPQRSTQPSTEWLKQNSSTAPGFIKKYFESSRLHHISTQKNTLKDYLISLLANRQKCAHNINDKKLICHVDMDCFFVAVSTRTRPDLTGCPVAVAHSSNPHDKSTSEIASCNYIARASGVTAGMTVGKAMVLCQQLTVLPYDFKLYEHASKGLYEVLVEFSSNIQAISCDEAFLEIHLPLNNLETSVAAFASKIRERVRDVTGCNASVGISGNILLSRLATKKAKPDGFHYVDSNDALTYMQTLPVRDLPGIGRKIQERLHDKFSVDTCRDLQNIQLHTLKADLGVKIGTTLYEFCRGIDTRKLENKPRLSVGAEVNWGIRFEHTHEVEAFLTELCNEAVSRLISAKLRTKLITLKIMKRKTEKEAYKVLGHGDCGTHIFLL